jgi:DNA invertase Pin-like site-specific DNA recombinase
MTEQAGVWLRVSSNRQDEESQRPDVMRWADTHGYRVTSEYVIHGKSAFKGSRKFDQTWQRVLDDMRSGRITILVVWKQDRLDRKLNTFQMLAQVVESGGRVEFVTQPHLNDLTTMGGRIALKVQEEIAYAESKDKSDRIYIKNNALRLAGSVTGKPNWGYEIKKSGTGLKVFTPTAEGRKYVPVIFRMVIEGKSQLEVAEFLSGVTGKKWNERYLPNIIRNPVYYGARRNAGQLVTEGLVSYSVWQAANAAMKSRVRGGRGSSKHEKALVAPICGACYGQIRDGCPSGKSPMFRIFNRHGSAYYRCWGHGPQRKGCGETVPCAQADEWVTEAMLGDPNPYTERVFIAGDDRADEIGKLRAAAMSAYLLGDREMFERLDSEATELEALPASPSHWEERVMGYSRGERFESLGPAERREELSQRWTVQLDKSGAMVLPRDWP